MKNEEIIIIGGGPCGMASAIACQEQGMNPLIIERGNIVHTIYQFPTHQTFFSSSEKLEVGGVPFVNERNKPVRIQALSYYRMVAQRNQLRINTFENVTNVKKVEDQFYVSAVNQNNTEIEYTAQNIIIATGYYDQPNYMGIPGEKLDKVTHYFKEGHPFLNKNVVVIGGKNSAVDAALELHKAGANTTVLYRGEQYSKSIKPWILPDFDSLVRKGIIQMEFNASVSQITEQFVYYNVDGIEKKISNDFVFAMTGYRPDLSFLERAGVEINCESGKPVHHPNTMQTNIAGLYIAGVIAAGFNNNEIFIENGRFHGEMIAKHIALESVGGS